MTLLPKVKLKVMPTFPGTVNGGTGIDATKANGAVTVSTTGVFPGGLQNFANDAAAAAGGVPINGTYRNGSVVMIRVT